MPSIIVSELAIYPVKSFAQIPLKKSYIDGFGLNQDRRWMVVDNNGKFITQRQQPRMCLLKPELIPSEGIEQGLIIRAPAMDALKVMVPSAQKTRQVTVWNDQCAALDCGNAAAQWLRHFLGIECRLVFFPGEEIRQVDLNFAQAGDRTAFADGFPILLISQASLDDLNSRMESPLPMKRFRLNLVVSGCDPFAEDSWRRIKIGEITMRVVKPCSRCVIPSIDVNSAEKGVEPTQTLLTYRKRDNKIYFGQNVIAEGKGEIKIEMPVEVLE